MMETPRWMSIMDLPQTDRNFSINNLYLIEDVTSKNQQKVGAVYMYSENEVMGNDILKVENKISFKDANISLLEKLYKADRGFLMKNIDLLKDRVVHVDMNHLNYLSIKKDENTDTSYFYVETFWFTESYLLSQLSIIAKNTYTHSTNKTLLRTFEPFVKPKHILQLAECRVDREGVLAIIQPMQRNIPAKNTEQLESFITYSQLMWMGIKQGQEKK